jgi:hypothetical protein
MHTNFTFIYHISRLVQENTPPGTAITQIIVSDPDNVSVPQSFVCDFLRNDHGWFVFDSNLTLRVCKRWMKIYNIRN